MKQNPHINILVQMAKIDGETHEAELELIREIGTSSSVSDEDIDDIIEKTEAADTLPSLEHLSKKDKVDLMTNLVMVMKIDGKIHKEEMKFCSNVIKKLGYDEDALFDLVSTIYTDANIEVNESEIRKRAEKYLD
ncbi:MAG: TerB family tellurite resistance protein [Fulvivirga sp.]|nr:TerB family tellurite resistance protein [Fulvivirga sp.]